MIARWSSRAYLSQSEKQVRRNAWMSELTTGEFLWKILAAVHEPPVFLGGGASGVRALGFLLRSRLGRSAAPIVVIVMER